MGTNLFGLPSATCFGSWGGLAGPQHLSPAEPQRCSQVGPVPLLAEWWFGYGSETGRETGQRWLGDLFVECFCCYNVVSVLSRVGFWSFALRGLSLGSGSRVGLEMVMWRCLVCVVAKLLFRSRGRRTGQHTRTDRRRTVLEPMLESLCGPPVCFFDFPCFCRRTRSACHRRSSSMRFTARTGYLVVEDQVRAAT